MKRKEVEQKKKRAPGAGRKTVDDKIKMIPLYIREKRLSELGGEKVVRTMCTNFLQSIAL